MKKSVASEYENWTLIRYFLEKLPCNELKFLQLTWKFFKNVVGQQKSFRFLKKYSSPPSHSELFVHSGRFFLPNHPLRKILLVQTQQKGTFCPQKPIRLYAHISGPFPRNILLVQTQPLRNILPLETHSCFINIPVCPNIKVYK